MGNVIMKAQQIAYGASNVEKALDDLSVPELIELNKRMDAIDAWKANVHEETYTGSELTIENALALPARSLITEINAIQDLHGLPFPYVGGAYKNKYKMRTTSATVNGITVTPNSDQTVQLSGTATDGSASIPLCDNLSEISTLFGNGGTFILSLKEGTYSGTLNVSIAYVETQGGATKYLLPNTPTEIPAGSIAMSSNLYVASGTTVQSLSHFAIQLEVGNTATSYAPYSNICSISGRDRVVITRSDGDEISEDFTIQLGQTVYGGTLDVKRGVLTITWAKIGSITRGAIDSSGKLYSLTFSGISIKPWEENGTPSAYTKCSHFVNEGLATARATGDKCIVQYYNGLYIGGYVGAESDLDTLLASGNLDVVCELATPTTIQLTPEQLELLKGYNRVTIESGSIELKALVLGGDY